MCSGRGSQFCGDPSNLDDPIEFTVLPAKGEPYRFYAVSTDKKYKLTFSVVPDLLIGNDRGCSVEVVRLTPKWEVVMIRMKGFQPAEKVEFSSDSYGEHHGGPVTIDPNGANDHTVILPYVAGKPTGSTLIKMSGTKCSPSVSFEWGKK